MAKGLLKRAGSFYNFVFNHKLNYIEILHEETVSITNLINNNKAVIFWLDSSQTAKTFYSKVIR